ncbi:restriction endonuclease subunit S [Pseudomonas oryzihabitans]|uniref:Type I restriction enzyme, S subunit n=1 Tax=Pseudomonas oryzihabitans TaxID=47885 RepID=A0A1G5NDL8_9PSED|nr:restriction endonuclease subunit S [Pseudomonas psychrotolerans]SCZ35485.1 type I restriction enzyme, S subunit [Pseudomonas psychrotolerans]
MKNLSGANLNNGAAVGPQGEGIDSPSTFPRYPAYKESRVEWLGRLPQHWIVGCLKHTLIELISGGTPESNNPAYWADGDGVPWVAISDMTKGLVINGTAKAITEDGLRSKGLRVMPAGGLLYSIYASIGKVAVLGLSAVTNQAILGLVVNGAVADQQFVRWWLVSLESWVKTVSSSNTQDNLNAEKVKNLPFAFPTLTEQTQIARFLDHETARIDALIEEQQRLIELLKEKRQSVISHAVTKGLDPTVPMKDSGVEWLGDVPAHWVVSKFGYISSVVRGGSPRPAGDPELFNGDYSPWVTVAEITKDDEIYLDETESFLTKKGSDQCRIFSKGTLVLSNSGATLGVPKILMIDANANDGVVGFENISLDKEYSYLYLTTLTEGLRDRAAGSGQPNLNTDIVKSIDVPIPPSNEVVEIVAAVKN